MISIVVSMLLLLLLLLLQSVTNFSSELMSILSLQSHDGQCRHSVSYMAQAFQRPTPSLWNYGQNNLFEVVYSGAKYLQRSVHPSVGQLQMR